MVRETPQGTIHKTVCEVACPNIRTRCSNIRTCQDGYLLGIHPNSNLSLLYLFSSNANSSFLQIAIYYVIITEYVFRENVFPKFISIFVYVSIAARWATNSFRIRKKHYENLQKTFLERIGMIGRF